MLRDTKIVVKVSDSFFLTMKFDLQVKKIKYKIVYVKEIFLFGPEVLQVP